MSHVCKVQTEFSERNKAHLETALTEIFGACERDATMNAYYQHENQKCDLVVRANGVRKFHNIGSDRDIGFKLVGGKFELVADEMDVPYLQAALGRVKQRYGVNVAKAQARLQGYVPQEINEKNGAIKLRLTR